MARSTSDKLRPIGWRETISLPVWGVGGIVAKSDTGARSSAIDVKNIQELPGERVRFEIALGRKAASAPLTIEAPIVRRTRIKSSNGKAQDRLIVKTRMRLGPVEKEIELSLARRKGMLCRVLLGRLALEGDFVVDSSRKYIFGAPPRAQAARGDGVAAKRSRSKRGTKKKRAQKMPEDGKA